MHVFTGQSEVSNASKRTIEVDGDPTAEPKPFVPERLKRAAKRKATIKAVTKAARKFGIPRKLARAIAKRKAAGQ